MVFQTFDQIIFGTVVHLAWKIGVCRERAAFDLTFQYEIKLFS